MKYINISSCWEEYRTVVHVRLHLRKTVKDTFILAKQLPSISFGIGLWQRMPVLYWLSAFADLHAAVISQTLQPLFTITSSVP
jgi:hypothetical protein